MLLAGSAHAAAITYTDLYALGEPAGFGSIGIGGGFQAAAGGQIVGFAHGPNDHALLWTPSATGGIDLTPSGFTSSQAYATTGTQQVGQADSHAMLWSGSASSYVDLNPGGFLSSAIGISGSQQVGYGDDPAVGHNHAMLWNGSATSFVDLNPTGFTSSEAFGTTGSQQVGYGYGSATGGNNHALLWSGSASGYVDLNPGGFGASLAYGADGTQQVGEADGHAMLWTGSAASYVDLNPTSGFTSSYAYGTDGTHQIGWGYVPGGYAHALLWSGSAGSAIDLNSVLPAPLIGSYAYSIDGNTIYGIAFDDSLNFQAIEWTIVPEPGSLGLLGLALLACAPRRRKQAG